MYYTDMSTVIFIRVRATLDIQLITPTKNKQINAFKYLEHNFTMF